MHSMKTIVPGCSGFFMASTDDQDVAADDGDKDQENKQSRSLAQEAGPFRHLYIRAASALKNTPNEGRLEKAEYRVL